MAIPAGILESAFADQLVYATAASLTATAEGTVVFDPAILGVSSFVGIVGATGVISTVTGPKKLDNQLMDWANLHPAIPGKKRPIQQTSGFLYDFSTNRRQRNGPGPKEATSFYALKRQQKVYRKNLARRRKARR